MKIKEILNNCSVWMPGRCYIRNEKRPIVSVLLPTFKRAQSGYFERAVQSVLNQNLKNIELIIIDDCSTDGTEDLINYFMEIDDRVSCIRHTSNIGLPAISEYEGYMKARGQYIAFIFDDNEWEKEYLDETISYMVRNKIKASYGVVKNYFGDNDDDYIELGIAQNIEYDIAKLLVTNFIPNGGVILHRDVIETVGLYDAHISLTRLCDWDLWIRISEKFRFEGTGILAGSEYGVKLDDSLGNTVKMNTWVSIERISKGRNENLIPKNYEDLDIVECNEGNSDLFIQNIKKFIKQYNKKKWYKDSIINRCIKSNNKMKYVIIMTESIDASTALSFERISKIIDNVTFRFVEQNIISESELIHADALICLRGISFFKSQIDLCKIFNIPMFYYIDDNFKELQLEDKKNNTLKKLADDINFEELSKFYGIIVSSKSLGEYFEKEKLHNNIILLEPTINYKNMFKYTDIDVTKEVNVAFMGGGFREHILHNIVMPALKRLSNEMPINVYIPKRNRQMSSNENEFPNLNVIEIPYSRSLDLTLFRYGAKNIHILIHCGPYIKNNEYKTENSLINATQLGAILIASDTLNYKIQCNEPKKLIITKNTEIEWYNDLKEIIQNKKLRSEIYINANEYCNYRYNPNKIAKNIEDILTKITCINYSDKFDRYDLLMSRREMQLNDQTRYQKKPRELFNAPICLSRLIKNKRAYTITCTVDNFSKLGICLASFGTFTSGKVKIKIISNKKTIRESTIDLEEFTRDNWTYINFEVIKNSLLQVYTVELDFKYEKGSDLVGVFEDCRRRTFLYKVINKLGYTLKLKDILFTDCR